jgi:hypothetical protein
MRWRGPYRQNEAAPVRALKLWGVIAALASAIAPASSLAEHRVTPLFARSDVIHVVVQAPIGRLISDRSAASAPVEGTLMVDGERAPISVKLSLRGITRRKSETCAFPPIRVDILESPSENSLFAGQRKLKLVSPCRAGAAYQQYVFLEYSAYLMYNKLTPLSYNVRLASIDYLDARGKLIASRTGYFLENEKDLARRNGLREAVVGDRISLSQLSPRDSVRHAIFEYMIGNIDWSQAAAPAGAGCCHNTKLLGEKQASNGLVPIPYDFDETGLVDPPYAVPPEGSDITDVTTRQYRGYCVFNTDALAVAADFRDHRSDILAVLDDVPQLDPGPRRKAAAYLERFFADIVTDQMVSAKLLRTCLGRR